MITGEQIKAARNLLGWSQLKLAIKAQLNDTAVRKFEKGQRLLSPKDLDLATRVLEAAGVEFARGKQPKVKVTNDLDSRDI
jgi:transcriptional regulator with XRE-family HTH domain